MCKKTTNVIRTHFVGLVLSWLICNHITSFQGLAPVVRAAPVLTTAHVAQTAHASDGV